jgi:hypothetical protein
MIDFDILITNFINYDLSLNLNTNDEVYYYVRLLKKLITIILLLKIILILKQ